MMTILRTVGQHFRGGVLRKGATSLSLCVCGICVCVYFIKFLHRRVQDRVRSANEGPRRGADGQLCAPPGASRPRREGAHGRHAADEEGDPGNADDRHYARKVFSFSTLL